MSSLRILLSWLILIATSQIVLGYLNEAQPPFIITSPKANQQIKHGDTVNVTWELTPGTRFPLYGYAAARTSKTIAGLVLPGAARDERYVVNVANRLVFTDYTYSWTVDRQIKPGEYQFGIGFYFHVVSPTFSIAE